MDNKNIFLAMYQFYKWDTKVPYSLLYILLCNSCVGWKFVFCTFIYYPGLGKKIDALGKKRDCRDVLEWRKSIVNHMYWCAASTPDGDGEVMKAKWQIVASHTQNIHENPNCAHGILEGDSSDRLWLERGLQLYIWYKNINRPFKFSVVLL